VKDGVPACSAASRDKTAVPGSPSSSSSLPKRVRAVLGRARARKRTRAKSVPCTSELRDQIHRALELKRAKGGSAPPPPAATFPCNFRGTGDTVIALPLVSMREIETN